MKQGRQQPVLITDAERSQREQLRSREIRYVIMMVLRGLCVLVGGVLVIVQAPLLVLWLPLCGVGMVLLPWFAVLLANDRPPRDEHRLISRLRRTRRTVQPNALPAVPEPKVIDAEP